MSGRWRLEKLMLLIVLLGSGCQREAEVVPVRGTVMYRGQPLRQGVVAFVSDPQRSSDSVLAVATIQPDGHFSLQWQERQGLPPGWYRISILCPNDRTWPERYCDPQRSGLEFQVLPQRDNTITIRLE